ncbi:MAG: YafY family protein [Kofleriaceae bacterium]
MRRADRLFLILHALRGRRRALPAHRLAETLEVSLRTVYRDVADLQRCGVPIEGEAGVGYVLRKGAEVPPLMFEREELEALVVGSRFVGAFGGRALGLAARTALLKIEAALPAALRQRAATIRVFAPRVADRIEDTEILSRLREAIGGHQVLRLDYRDERGRATKREVEPLCLSFWGDTWTLGAFCRLRQAHRSFRADRLGAFAPTGEVFVEEPGRDLEAYLATLGLRED